MKSTRWVSASGYCSVEISSGAMKRMHVIADRAHPREGGSALHGYYSDDGRTAFVDGVAPESGNSESGRFHFKRGAQGLASFFQALFKRSRGERFYVGEFHSHPGGAPEPSSTDDATQFDIARDGAWRCEAPVLVVVGGSPAHRQVAVFVHTRSGAKYALVRTEEGEVSSSRT